MQKITCFLLSCTLLYADALPAFLKQLGEEKELYHKTKVESAGSLILFSREELEKMQAYTLRDLLKSLRFYTYKEGYIAEGALSLAGQSSVLSSNFRLYIDGYEVSSAIYGSSMLEFLDMDIDFVDHVEIYEGGNAIAFGDEPGFTTIRLYSKEASKENVNTLSLSTDDRGSLTTRLLLTGNADKSAFILSAIGNNVKRDRREMGGTFYSKDASIQQIYGRYAFADKYKVYFGYFKKVKDAFVGVGRMQTPIDPNEISREQLFFNLKYNFTDNLSLTLSTDRITHLMKLSDRNKIFIAQYPHTPFTYFDGHFNESIYKAELSDAIAHIHGKFSWGLLGIKKEYEIEHMLLDGINHSSMQGPSNLNLFSAFAEENFSINPYNRVVATLKIDNYRNDDDKHDTELIARLGYIALFDEHWSSKTFIAHSYLYPGFAYTSTFPNAYKENPNLGPEHQDNIIQEFKYSSFTHTLIAGGEYIRQKDRITIDRRRTFTNSTEEFKQLRYYLDYIYRWDNFNTLKAEIFATDTFVEHFTKQSPSQGGYLRLMNEMGNIVIFNELIYREGYRYHFSSPLIPPIKIEEGFDYNAGIRWEVNRAIRLSLKGENLLHKASQSPIYRQGAVDSIQKRFLINMEYSF